MEYKAGWTRQAMKDLADLNKSLADRITCKVDYFCEQENLFRFAKPLGGELKGFYRFCIGEYRAIFEKTKDNRILILLILRIKHRKDIY
jgi:addiction module RelE/StbE family toxin